MKHIKKRRDIYLYLFIFLIDAKAFTKENEKNYLISALEKKYDSNNNSIIDCINAKDFASYKYLNVCNILNAYGFINLSGSTTIRGEINYFITKMNINSPLDTSGIINANGCVNAQSFCTFSDQRLKKDIKDIDTKESLALILKLRPRTYLFSNNAQNKFGFTKNKQRGFIAQEVKEVLPNSISISNEAIKIETEEISDLHKLNSDQIIADLVGAIQECYKRIESLEAELKK